jgi:hypothetical protein
VVISHEKYLNPWYIFRRNVLYDTVDLESIGMGAIGKLTLTPKVKSNEDQLVFRMSEKRYQKSNTA